MKNNEEVANVYLTQTYRAGSLTIKQIYVIL